VHVMQAQGDAKYGDQNTDGSKSVRLLLNRHCHGNRLWSPARRWTRLAA
jgi:hypothetical protein